MKKEKREIRVVFMGTPDFAVGVLSKLVAEKVKIVGVITAPDKPAGRGRKIHTSAVKDYAVSQGLTVLQPTNLKNEGFLKELEALNANLQIVVAFRMLPKVVWQMPEYGTFNLHASLLPEYRGAAPINWAIINQENKTGVTTFFIDEKIDTGAIILSSEILIEERETAGTLHDKLMEIGSNLVVETVQLIEKNTINPYIQKDARDLKEAPKLHPENTEINWSQPVKKIDALVRGLSPYPVAWTKIKNEEDIYKVKIYSSSFEIVKHNEAVGTITTTKKTIKIAAEDGYLFIEVLQFPGKRKMDAASFLNGFTFAENAKAL